MVSYLPERRLLFSQDAFGMHLASSERFGDELPENILVAEGEKYFANILMPYAQLIHKAVERLTGAGIEIEIIAPDHGPIWREKPEWILGKYLDMGRSETEEEGGGALRHDVGEVPRKWLQGRGRRVVTRRRGGRCAGTRFESSHGVVATSILEAGALIVGSPTMNNQVYPSLARLHLIYLKGLKPNKPCWALRLALTDGRVRPPD